MGKSKSILICAVAAALVTGPVTRASADADGLVGGIIGGMIGGAIVQEQRKSQQRRTTTRTRYVTSKPSVSATQRQENRDIQTALNYFGFPAGTADGVLGRRSREAISGYQAFLSFPATGTLAALEKNILLSAHARAVSGAPDTMRLISTSPLGPRAALEEQKRLMLGGGRSAARSVGYPGLPLEVSQAVDEIAESSDPTPEQLMQRSGFIQLSDLNGDGNNDYILDTSYSGSTFWCRADRQCTALVFVSSPKGYVRNDLLVVDPTPASFSCIGTTCTRAEPGEPQMAAAEPVPAPDTGGGTVMAGAALPSFGAPAATQQASLASRCNTVTLMSATRGGFITEAGGGLPDVALAEQFCFARGVSVEQSQRLLTQVGGGTLDQAAAQCDAFATALKGQITGLSIRPASDVLNETAAFVLNSGMTPEQLTNTATICLGAAYHADNMDAALGASLLMVALGHQAYAELLGHHLLQGYGTSKRKDLARDWYDRAFMALEKGATPVFATEKGGRTELMIWAVKGGTDTASVPVETPEPVSMGLPSFGTPSK